MPMTPEEWARKRAEMGNPVVARLCEDIDKEMIIWDGTTPLRWAMPCFRDGGDTQRAIVETYTAKGWSVRPIAVGSHVHLEFMPA